MIDQEFMDKIESLVKKRAKDLSGSVVRCLEKHMPDASTYAEMMGLVENAYMQGALDMNAIASKRIDKRLKDLEQRTEKLRELIGKAKKEILDETVH